VERKERRKKMGDQILTDEILGTVKGGLSKVPASSPNVANTPINQTEGAPPPIEGSFHGSLEEAANLLMTILPPSIKDYACELADIVLKIPRWQLLLGSLMAQNESGNLAAPSLDPGWRQVELLIQKSICGWEKCKKVFTPDHFGQLYCSNQCGNAARKADIDKNNELKEKVRKAEQKAMREAGLTV
jgi:hypothetical protein